MPTISALPMNELMNLPSKVGPLPGNELGEAALAWVADAEA